MLLHYTFIIFGATQRNSILATEQWHSGTGKTVDHTFWHMLYVFHAQNAQLQLCFYQFRSYFSSCDRRQIRILSSYVCLWHSQAIVIVSCATALRGYSVFCTSQWRARRISGDDLLRINSKLLFRCMAAPVIGGSGHFATHLICSRNRLPNIK